MQPTVMINRWLSPKTGAFVNVPRNFRTDEQLRSEGYSSKCFQFGAWLEYPGGSPVEVNLWKLPNADEYTLLSSHFTDESARRSGLSDKTFAFYAQTHSQPWAMKQVTAYKTKYFDHSSSPNFQNSFYLGSGEISNSDQALYNYSILHRDIFVNQEHALVLRFTLNVGDNLESFSYSSIKVNFSSGLSTEPVQFNKTRDYHRGGVKGMEFKRGLNSTWILINVVPQDLIESVTIEVNGQHEWPRNYDKWELYSLGMSCSPYPSGGEDNVRDISYLISPEKTPPVTFDENMRTFTYNVDVVHPYNVPIKYYTMSPPTIFDINSTF